MVVVREVLIDGSSRYEAGRLSAVAGIAPGRVTVGSIEAARQKLVDLYRSDGFVLTTVNRGLDAQGRLRFVITEGRIADVKLDGDIGPAGVQVLRFLERLKDYKPIDAATLERYLLLAQDVPGVTVRSVLRPSTEEPGALTLIAQVSRSWYSGLVTADNRGAPFTGPEQGLAVVSLNSFTQFGERTELSIFRSFNDTQIYGQAAVEVFLGSSGLKLRAYGGSGTADPSGNLRAIGYHGITSIGGVSLSYPVIRTRQQTLNVGGYFDILESNITTGFSPPAIASRDNLRVLRLGVDYVRQDNWLGSEFSAVNAASLRVSKGTPVLGASRNGDIRAGRLNERTDFGKVNFEASRTQTLYQFGDNSNFALQGTLAGQYSPDVLPAAEKFFLGGPRWNRGYYSGEVTGDTALSAAVELQYNTGFTVDVFSAPREISTQFYGFYDWGETWESQKTDANHRLQSYGLGARVSVTRWTEFNVEGVHRLVRRPQGASSNVSALKSDAFYWRVLTRF